MKRNVERNENEEKRLVKSLNLCTMLNARGRGGQEEGGYLDTRIGLAIGKYM